MRNTRCLRLGVVALIVGLAVCVTVPVPASAQLPLPLPGGGSSSTGTGATALAVTVLGSTTSFASTGNLANWSDALGTALDSAGGSLGSAEVLAATAIGSGDGVASDASLGDLVLSILGTQITATSAYATAFADNTGATGGWSTIDGLAVNGVSIVPTGAPNQTISLGAVTLVLNEVTYSASGIVVNALHITSLDGTVDVIVASATAGQ